MDECDSICRMWVLLTGMSPAASHSTAPVQTVSGSWIPEILILIVLILINGFFSASEFSLVSLNHNKVRRMAEEGNRAAQKLLKLVSNPSGFLATIQVGVTFAGFLSSAFASDQFAQRLQFWLDPTGQNHWIKTASMVVITLILSFFSLVFGELVPKRIALQNPERMARGIAGFIHGFNIVMTPFTRLLAWSTNVVLRVLKIDPNYSEQAMTEEDLRILLDASNENGNIQVEEKEMIDNIFEFNDKEVSEIMTHRTNVVALKLEASLEETVQVCCEEKFSRIPVYEENIDNIVGILHIKDVLTYLAQPDTSRKTFELGEWIRQPYVTPETKTIDSLFREMQKERVQLAIVIDEYGGTAGIVTIEDLLEEIVGNIQDEYDEEEAEIVHQQDGSYWVDGRTALDDVAKQIADFPDPEVFEGEDFDTLAGYLLHLLDRIPEEDEHPTVTEGVLRFEVLEMDEKRISKIRIEVIPEEERVLPESEEEKEEHD